MDPVTDRLNADPAQRVVIESHTLPWQASPQPGVLRRPLERIGGEIARATSLVRYVPGSAFPRHGHPGGEEILVLDGVFEDDEGVYPAGTYLRNPPGSSHAPRSLAGCLLFVKLWQFAPDDRRPLRIDTRSAPWFDGLVPGLSVQPLHAHDGVDTALVRWAAGTRFKPHVHPGGEEIYVIDGVFEDEDGAYAAGTWIRNPRYSRHTPFTRDGALIWVKVGHLGAAQIPLPAGQACQ